MIRWLRSRGSIRVVGTLNQLANLALTLAHFKREARRRVDAQPTSQLGPATALLLGAGGAAMRAVVK